MQKITQEALNEEIKRQLRDLVESVIGYDDEEGAGIETLEKRVDEGKYEEILNMFEAQGMNLIDINDGSKLDKLGEILCAGIIARCGFDVHKKD